MAFYFFRSQAKVDAGIRIYLSLRLRFPCVRSQFSFLRNLCWCPSSFCCQASWWHNITEDTECGIPGGSNRPTGVDEKDTLKDFHRALAVQATTEQIAQFQTLVKISDSAQASLTAFLQQPAQVRTAGSAASAVQIDQLLQNLRADHQRFVDGFSASQRSGLKDLVKKLGRAGSGPVCTRNRAAKEPFSNAPVSSPTLTSYFAVLPGPPTG